MADDQKTAVSEAVKVCSQIALSAATAVISNLLLSTTVTNYEEKKLIMLNITSAETLFSGIGISIVALGFLCCLLKSRIRFGILSILLGNFFLWSAINCVFYCLFAQLLM